jgi:hypothetical protein
MKKSLCATLAFLVDQYHRQSSISAESAASYKERVEYLVNEELPSGSGFDCGTKINIEASNKDKLVFFTEYHHMQNGMYTKWTAHRVIVTSSLAYGMELKVTGVNHNDIKPYIHDTFSHDLAKNVEIPQK